MQKYTLARALFVNIHDFYTAMLKKKAASQSEIPLEMSFLANIR